MSISLLVLLGLVALGLYAAMSIRNRYYAAMNVLMARYTFDRLNRPEQEAIKEEARSYRRRARLENLRLCARYRALWLVRTRHECAESKIETSGKSGLVCCAQSDQGTKKRRPLFAHCQVNGEAKLRRGN